MTKNFNIPNPTIVGTPCPIEPSAQFTINSVNKGALFPRLTTVEMNLINNPANGLILYNTMLADDL